MYLSKQYYRFGGMDPRWEYQAPQFVDFNNLGGGTAPEGEDRADEFFNIDMESGERFLLPKLFNVFLKSEHCFHFSCVPEEGVKDTGLVVNDTPAGSAMEEVEESVENSNNMEVDYNQVVANPEQ